MRRNTPSNKLIRGSRCPCPIGGSRRACGAGRASSRRAEQSSRHGQQAGGQASVPVGDSRTWPSFETTHQANDQQPSTVGMEAAAGPAGHASVPVGGGRARADYPAALSSARLEAAAGPARQASVPVGGGRAWPGFETTRQANDQQPSTVGMEAAAGPAGPGRASRRRAERSSRRGRRAGGQAPRRPEIRRCHKPRPKVRTPRSTPGSGRPGGRRGDRAR